MPIIFVYCNHSTKGNQMARYIDADARTRHFQYHLPAARKALREGWAEAELKALKEKAAKMGERPDGSIEQQRWDRRMEQLRRDYRAVARQQRMDRWLAGEIDCPPEVRAEYAKHGQRIASWLRDDTRGR